MTTDKQVSFYNDLWSNRPKVINQHEAQRLAKILSAMVAIRQRIQKPVPKICDLGCGTGWLANELRVFGNVTAVDWSPEGVRIAEQRWHGINFETSDVLDYRPDDAFDVVVSSEVIEHVEDKAAFMDTVAYLLRNGGFLIITCPNGNVEKYYENMDLKKQPIDEWPTYKELRNLVERFFEVEYQETFVFNFSQRGVLRIINSHKLNCIFKFVGLSRIFQCICCFTSYGLYQIIVARKIRPLNSGSDR